MSLVVANGAIYNRIVIPGKTRLLTPRRGTGQGGGIWHSPLCLSQLQKEQTVRSWSPLCLLQGRSPCLALLCCSRCQGRMLGSGGHREGWRGLSDGSVGGLAGRGSASPLDALTASAAEPAPGFSQVSPPAACVCKGDLGAKLRASPASSPGLPS